MFERIRAGIAEFRRRNTSYKRAREKARLTEKGEYVDKSTFANADFNKDYDLACMIVRNSINGRFPDNYHARSMPGFDPHFNYSARRNEAIDISSAAVATALRQGKGISSAVTAGTMSVGL